MAVALDPTNQSLTLALYGDQAKRDATGQIMVPENLSFNTPKGLSQSSSLYATGGTPTEGAWAYGNPSAGRYGKTAINNSAGDTLGYWFPNLPGQTSVGSSKRPSYQSVQYAQPDWMKQNASKFGGGYILDPNEVNDPNSFLVGGNYRGIKKPDKGFLGDLGPVVGLASMFVPGMQGIGAALMAANAIDSGNLGGLAAAALPFIPGVGSALGGAGSWLSDTAGISSGLSSSIVNGLAGGGLSSMFGGDFTSGALSAGLSTAAAPQINSLFNTGLSSLGGSSIGTDPTQYDLNYSQGMTDANSGLSQAAASTGAEMSTADLQNMPSFNDSSSGGNMALDDFMDNSGMSGGGSSGGGGLGSVLSSGGGMGGNDNWIKAAKLLSGLYGEHNNNNIADQLQRSAAGMDPFGSQRPMYQSMLAKSFSDPFSAPEFSRLQAIHAKQMMQHMANKGLRGNQMQMQAELEDNATKNLNQYRTLLSQLAGSNIGPGAGANLLTQAAGLRKSGADNLTGGLSALFNNRIDPSALMSMLGQGGGGLQDLFSLLG